MFSFDVIPGTVVRRILESARGEVLDIVRDTYLLHRAGSTINPDSYFLRFPDKPEARIIALPAYVGGDVDLAGIKWIGSFPRNIETDIPRASAVLLLNDYATGYPVACLEAATISSARTAASAALAASVLRPHGYAGGRIAVVGAGVIARTVCDYLESAGVAPDGYLVHDLDAPSGAALVGHIENALGRPATVAGGLDEALDADTVLFTTTAPRPYVDQVLRPGQLVLNISLRDLAPEVVLGAQNILDDVDHCLKASTSPHLAEQLSGSREFVTGTLADVLTGAVTPEPARPVIFSPFGLGVLDIAVGAFVHSRARAEGSSLSIPEFFGETVRW